MKDQFFSKAALEKLTLTKKTFCNIRKNTVVKVRSITARYCDRLSDGIESNSEFGSGQVVAQLRGVSGFTSNNIGLSLAAIRCSSCLLRSSFGLNKSEFGDRFIIFK